MFLGCFAAFYFIDLTETAFGRLLAPVIGEPKESGAYGRFVVFFYAGLSFLPESGVNRVLEISGAGYRRLAGTDHFVYGLLLSFDLSLPFIQSKLWFFNFARRFYHAVCVGDIHCAGFYHRHFWRHRQVVPNGFAFAIASFYTSFFSRLAAIDVGVLIYLGMPQMGYVVNAVPAGIAALSLCYGAYMTEIFRAGIESISRGQWEGARALGFRFSPTMRMIILPQAVPLIIPPTGNQFIAMLKDSSLVSVIGVWELMFFGEKNLALKLFSIWKMLITVAIIYWMMTIVLETIQARIESHYRKIQR